MKQRAYEWDPRPPTIREQIVAGIWLTAFVPVMLNYCVGWGLFRGYDKWVFGGLFLASFFLMARMPGVRRVEGVPLPVTYWSTLGLGLMAAIALWVLSSKR
jgi:hypothetical protein